MHIMSSFSEIAIKKIDEGTRESIQGTNFEMHIPMFKDLLRTYKKNQTEETKNQVIQMVLQIFCGRQIEYINKNDKTTKEVIDRTIDTLINTMDTEED